ncbi:MAG TPA: lasso peptide biosynthesis B2 protein, partial [Pyrinomonadaceae bacterium]
DQISNLRRVGADQAEALLRRQLSCWERAELTQWPQPASPLPQPKTSAATSRTELSMESLASEPFVPWLAALLFYEELKYRRTIVKKGLAVALIKLQSERGSTATVAERIIIKTVRNYYLLRRAFRQGVEARDCLFRSFALAALLRQQGVNADLCFGIIDLPFSSHAWVEAEGCVLNETLRSCGRYEIIGRF